MTSTDDIQDGRGEARRRAPAPTPQQHDRAIRDQSRREITGEDDPYHVRMRLRSMELSTAEAQLERPDLDEKDRRLWQGIADDVRRSIKHLQETR